MALARKPAFMPTVVSPVENIPNMDSEDIPDLPIYRLSPKQYHAMSTAGILQEDDPVEFLEGWLVRKMTKHPPHIYATLSVRQEIERLLPAGYLLYSQDPLDILGSEPEPDAAVLRGDRGHYRQRLPSANDVAFVVEVAEASLRVDRGIKKRLYAQAGVQVYWIVNLRDNLIEVYSDPTGATDRPTYRTRQDYSVSDEIPVVIDGVELGRIPVNELLP